MIYKTKEQFLKNIKTINIIPLKKIKEANYFYYNPNTQNQKEKKLYSFYISYEEKNIKNELLTESQNLSKIECKSIF